MESDKKQYSFVHRLANNLSDDISIMASTNLSFEMDESMLHRVKLGAIDPSLPLPPLVELLGTKHMHKYWHRILLGVTEIHVETTLVPEKEQCKLDLLLDGCLTTKLSTVNLIFLSWRNAALRSLDETPVFRIINTLAC